MIDEVVTKAFCRECWESLEPGERTEQDKRYLVTQTMPAGEGVLKYRTICPQCGEGSGWKVYSVRESGFQGGRNADSKSYRV